MSRVALIQTFPYEAVWGGDAVYLDRIRTFLTARGHDVDTYVTDITRGRSSPLLKVPIHASSRHRWHVRNALSFGQGRYCSLDPRLFGKALSRLPGRRAVADHCVADTEGHWVAARLAAARPDLIILAFGACIFAKRLAVLGVPVIALKGFFSDRRIRLGEQTAPPVVGRTLLEQLGHATHVGFNNRHDLDHYEQLSGTRHGVLIGMGFADRLQPPIESSKAILFVAARTKPNVESLEWFLRDVWPHIRRDMPAAELRVAGSVCSAFLNRTCDGVTFVGFVPSLDAEYRGAAMAVAPLVNGSSGIKTKIAEALSFGRPVVTTSLGVDPSDPTQYGDAVAVADQPAAFAAAVVAGLGDGAVRAVRTRAAAEQFHRHLAEDVAYHEILALLDAERTPVEAAA